MGVYFIQMGGPDGPIKIGSAINPENRRRELQTAAPGLLTILRVIDGSTREEFALHRHFERARQHGEWFAPEPILNYLLRRDQDGIDEKTLIALNESSPTAAPMWCGVCGRWIEHPSVPDDWDL